MRSRPRIAGTDLGLLGKTKPNKHRFSSARQTKQNKHMQGDAVSSLRAEPTAPGSPRSCGPARAKFPGPGWALRGLSPAGRVRSAGRGARGGPGGGGRGSGEREESARARPAGGAAGWQPIRRLRDRHPAPPPPPPPLPFFLVPGRARRAPDRAPGLARLRAVRPSLGVRVPGSSLPAPACPAAWPPPGSQSAATELLAPAASAPPLPLGPTEAPLPVFPAIAWHPGCPPRDLGPRCRLA